MNTKRSFSLLIAFIFSFSSSAYGQRGSSTNKPDTTAFTQNAVANAPSTTTSTVYPVGVSQLTTTTTLPIKGHGTIQDWAAAAQARTNKGQQIATVLQGVAGIGVMATCWKPTSKCKWWVAALVASFLMGNKMKKASSDTQMTLDAVTNDPDLADAPKIDTTTSTDITDANYDTTPDGKRVKSAVQNFEKHGWKIDKKTAKLTNKKTGETIDSMKLMENPVALKKAGAPDSVVKQVAMAHQKGADLAMKQSANSVKKAAEQKAGTADSGEGAFSDDLGGGGGAAPSFAMAADGGLGRYQAPNAALGIDRNPAQVAGMKKDYNGSPIGVAGDSLFEMIDRRYELHQKNGSFLEP